MKFVPCVQTDRHTDRQNRQTDGRRDMKLIVAFFKFEKVPKKTKYIYCVIGSECLNEVFKVTITFLVVEPKIQRH